MKKDRSEMNKEDRDMELHTDCARRGRETAEKALRNITDAGGEWQ